MVDATFEKVTTSDKPLFGPRKLLLCGFPSVAQPKFGTVLDMVDLQEVPKIPKHKQFDQLTALSKVEGQYV